jgi:hypothetical protein
MDSYYALHLPSGATYTAYTYYQIYVNAGATLVYKGVTLPSPSAGPIVLNLTVNSTTDIAGSSGIALLGKKKPEAFAEGPAGQNGLNTDGTWNIRG